MVKGYVICQKMITEKLARKRVEMEMLGAEIEVLDRMLEM